MFRFFLKRAKLVNRCLRTVKKLLENNATSELERASSVLRYEGEWLELHAGLGWLRTRAIQGDFRASRFRSVLWRILLGLFTPGEPELWADEASKARMHYRRMKMKFNHHPWNRTDSDPELGQNDNPLSQEDGSTWNQYFCDRELRLLIEQDVVRTFPGVDFFKDKELQDAMVDILFCYAREYPKMCYRQGMHEILAPLIFVFYCDHQAFSHILERDALSDTMCEILNPEYLVEDCYMLFTRIMESTAVSYQTSDVQPTSTGSFPSRCETGMSLSSDNQMMDKLNWIDECLIKPADEVVYKHLIDLKITLPIYGIRWLRLLFGREFPLQDLLVLWDAIFAEGGEFQLVNYIVVAMLLGIRDQLLASGYAECMNILMRYPPQADIGYIIKKALHLQNPQKNKDPPLTTAQLPRPVRPDDKSPPLSPHTPVRRRPQQLDRKQKKQAVASSLTNSIMRLSSGRRRKGPTLPVAAAPNEVIVDGFAFQEPGMLLINELRENRELMNLCRLKLVQYHAVMEKEADPSNVNMQQVITGVHELCSLLDEKNASPFVLSLISTPPSSATEIEPAYEVGESSRLSLISPAASPASSPASASQQPSSPFKLPPPKTNVDMTTFRETEGPVLETILLPTSLQRR